MTTTQTIVLASTPKPVGYWVLGWSGDGHPYVQFCMYKKPTDEQIKNTEALLGWKWIDA